MWTDGIESFIKSRQLAKKNEWSAYLDQAADMAKKYRSNLPKRLNDRTQERKDDARRFEADADALMEWIEHGTGLDHDQQGQVSAAIHIQQCLALSSSNTTAE
ncbi:MAG: hypothetical protein KYX67_12210 [Brevundimonas sp.]|uniref:hypothetical protein n=1 Tax=Brevundimonas sp. TaxID=1871086 RepID=UPI00256D223F|nr:hypothetical protein [Brevundimonas sp.]MDK2748074.1 hypothetical protein [Brevundimonas sp.]